MSDDGQLAALGKAVAWVNGEAIRALGRRSPEEAARLVDGLEAGQVRLETRIGAGAGLPASVEVHALDGEGHDWLVAAMVTEPIEFN